MNIWCRGSLTRNPYVRTAFRVARIPREIVRHQTLIQSIGTTKRIVSADPQAHVIGGEPVTHAEINVAEQILVNPSRRIVEELLEHATERPPLERVRKLAREAGGMMGAHEAGRLPVANLSGLRAWADVLVQQFLDDAPPPDPSFGALELKIVPPFGQSGGE